MKPVPYLHIFAVISITALSLQIFTDFWVPVVIGAVAMFFAAVILRR
ncbi:hypothetical protein JIN84_17430 [Luteolibacter yonseiensis]|uniref:Uncharacterized protein n=1 Tax=Luteolibacter yonseiensis TaxID=1144680 RepID=A0A934R583_9BACT|nr:hypothetical protein [Luteolibacter yonseiensis]MBK1817406.1 hypothetical protein [Luteolibacter yonseiensis]